MPCVLIATANSHKVEEIRSALGPSFVCRSQRDAQLGLTVEETGCTFAENAQLKAITWARSLSLERLNLGIEWVLADDSGLEVDALGGAPGVHSARFAALDDGRSGNSPDAENNAKLLRLLAEVPLAQRTARFRCSLALTPLVPGADPEVLAKLTHHFEGTCEGRIHQQPIGTGGFGYDPLFGPTGNFGSFATLGETAKNQLSHRGAAIKKLVAWFATSPSF